MPAITADTPTLPRVAVAAPFDTSRPVRSITTGPRGYEGEVEYEPGEPRGTDWRPHRGFETVRP